MITVMNYISDHLYEIRSEELANMANCPSLDEGMSYA